MIGALTLRRPNVLATVDSNIVLSPTNLRNCLGIVERDAGHSLVPEPPDKITGISMD
jgi:hypothetical protein